MRRLRLHIIAWRYSRRIMSTRRGAWRLSRAIVAQSYPPVTSGDSYLGDSY
jgi:hypothetical protein